MMLNVISRLRRLLGDERGQVLPITALMTTAFLGMAAIVVDIGDVYYSYNELVTSTNAAAMAGAEGLPSNTSTVN
jgi:Flp pilus assembly protein TadG